MEFKYASKITDIWINKEDYPRISINWVKQASIVLSETIDEAAETHRGIIKEGMKDKYVEQNYDTVLFEIMYTTLIKGNIIRWTITHKSVFKL